MFPLSEQEREQRAYARGGGSERRWVCSLVRKRAEDQAGYVADLWCVEVGLTIWTGVPTDRIRFMIPKENDSC